MFTCMHVYMYTTPPSHTCIPLWSVDTWLSLKSTFWTAGKYFYVTENQINNTIQYIQATHQGITKRPDTVVTKIELH